MAFKLSDLEQIPQRNKDLTFGYFKECRKVININQIPLMIEHLCLIYMNQNKDGFDTKETNSKMNIFDGNCIEVKKFPRMNIELKTMTVNSYLENIAENGIHIWRIKCKQMGVSSGMFGIRNIEISTLRQYGDFDEISNAKKASVGGYSVYLAGLKKEITNNGCEWKNGGLPKEFAKGCVTNDIIEMTVNFRTLSLYYKINNDDYGKAFDIKQGRYRAVVGLSMWCPIWNRPSNVELELLSYQYIV